MASKIQLTPAELLSQSQEMLSLQKEFSDLFGQSEKLLNQVTTNWSTNLANNFAGKLTSAQKGFKQIECVAQRLSTVQFDAAYSSPLTRARLTAEAILHGSDVELQLDDRLKELAFGVWEGKSLEEIQETDA